MLLQCIITVYEIHPSSEIQENSTNHKSTKINEQNGLFYRISNYCYITAAELTAKSENHLQNTQKFILIWLSCR